MTYVIARNGGYEGHSPPLLAIPDRKTALVAVEFMKAAGEGGFVLFEVPDWPQAPNKWWDTTPCASDHLVDFNNMISTGGEPTPPRRDCIQAAVYAALGCTKIDYRSPKSIDEGASQIANFVEDALGRLPGAVGGSGNG